MACQMSEGTRRIVGFAGELGKKTNLANLSRLPQLLPGKLFVGLCIGGLAVVDATSAAPTCTKLSCVAHVRLTCAIARNSRVNFMPLERQRQFLIHVATIVSSTEWIAAVVV